MHTLARPIELQPRHDLEEAIRVLTYRHPDELRPATRQRLAGLMEETRELIHPRGMHTVHHITRLTETDLELKGCPPFQGPVAAYFAPARRIVTFAVTIGPQLEHHMEAVRCRSDASELCALHAIGAAAVNEAADIMVDHIIWNEASPDEALTPPLSPGQCDVPAGQYRSLFEILDPSPLGVQLLHDGSLSPVYSVAGMVGIGPAALVEAHGVPCDWCGNPECRMHRRR
jgi:hypothetical protein